MILTLLVFTSFLQSAFAEEQRDEPKITRIPQLEKCWVLDLTQLRGKIDTHILTVGQMKYEATARDILGTGEKESYFPEAVCIRRAEIKVPKDGWLRPELFIEADHPTFRGTFIMSRWSERRNGLPEEFQIFWHPYEWPHPVTNVIGILRLGLDPKDPNGIVLTVRVENKPLKPVNYCPDIIVEAPYVPK